MVCFVPSPPTISSTHPICPDRSQPFLHSCLILTLHQEWTWLGLCAPWFASSHLPPPSHSLTHSTPTGLSKCFTHIKSLPCINTWHGGLSPHLHPTPCSLTLPHNPHTVLWLAGFKGYSIGGLGAH